MGEMSLIRESSTGAHCFWAYAQHMAQMARSEPAKHMFGLFAEQERQLIKTRCQDTETGGGMRHTMAVEIKEQDMVTVHTTTKTKAVKSWLLSKKLVVSNRSGLHLRLAAVLAKMASAFDAEIHIESEHSRASAKSILALLAINASSGEELTVTAEGHDAHAAIQEIEQFFALRLGEEDS